MTNEMIIRIHHIRAMKNYCMKATRKFFVAHNWPWTDFTENGRRAQDFIDTGDARAIRLVEVAMAAETPSNG